MSELTPAPVCLFVYSRPTETERTLRALAENHLASQTHLHVFSDAPKSDQVEATVAQVRKLIKTIKGFHSVTIHESTSNKGLATSIIEGVTKILQSSDRVIVLEDDLVTSPNFLDFMNQGINWYEYDKTCHSICGFTHPLPSLNPMSSDSYIGVRSSSWGWATWRDRWTDVDWSRGKVYKALLDTNLMNELKKGGVDMPRMLRRQRDGEIDSWAIRWCLHQTIHQQYAVFPTVSKVLNIGFGSGATHTKYAPGIPVQIDQGDLRRFKFESNPKFDPILLNEFKQLYSIKNRLLNKLKQVVLNAI